jgi:hypothetical protein
MKLAPSGGRILKRGSRPIFAIDSARSRSSVMARHVGREWFLIPADNADDDEYAPSDEERHGADRDQHQDDLPGHGHDHGSCGQSVGANIIMALAPNFMQEASNNPILSYPQILNNTLRCAQPIRIQNARQHVFLQTAVISRYACGSSLFGKDELR